MADSTRLSTQTCLSLSELKQVIHNARADGQYTADEEAQIDGILDWAYYCAEQMDGVLSMFEYGSKRGVEAMLNRPNTEKVVSIVELRMRRDAKRQAKAASGDYPPAA